MWQNISIAALVIVAGLLAVCKGQVTDFGCCPNVKSAAKFRPQNVHGEMVRGEKVLCGVPACRQQVHNGGVHSQGDGTVKVNNTGYRPMTGNYSSIIGQAQVLDPREPAKLGVRFFPGTPLGNYWVLETDYDQYSVVWSCRQMSRFFNSQLCWILTRRPEPLPAPVNDRIYSLLKGYEINPDFFIVSDQTRCPGR